MNTSLNPEPVAAPPQEIVIDLKTPGDDPAPMKVRVLGNNRFLCLESNDLSAPFRILSGDTFEAELLTDRLYLFRSVTLPSAMLHFQVDCGFYVLSPGSEHVPDAEEKMRAANELGEIIHGKFHTPALIDFLKQCKGGWELDEFFQCFTLIIHLPRACRESFLSAMPDLCPGLRNDKMEEIFSGATK